MTNLMFRSARRWCAPDLAASVVTPQDTPKFWGRIVAFAPLAVATALLAPLLGRLLP
jgi:hypothetical protein